MWTRLALSATLALAPWMVWASGPLATVTLSEGRGALLLRDTSSHKLSEGVRLRADDMIDTGHELRFLRLEFSDGALVDLGPDTRVLLSPQFSGERSKSRPRLYLLQGWLKYSAPSTAPVAALPVASTPTLELSTVSQQAVIAITPESNRDASYVFAETGVVTLTERRAGKPGQTITLKAQPFYARNAEGKAGLSARPTAEFMKAIPRPFLDTLPRRAAAWKEREVQPGAPSALSYAQAQPWIDAEAALRPAALQRWKTLAQHGPFRNDLAAHMKAHPEWDRVLYPEKYRPASRTVDTSASAASTRSAR